MRAAAVREVRALWNLGLDLITLHGKVPTERSWQKKPRKAWEELEPQLLKNGTNVGVRCGMPLEGYCGAIIDRDVVGELEPEELAELEAAEQSLLRGQVAPQLTSGFGHGSCHHYVLTRTPAKTQLIAKAKRVVSYEKAGKRKRGPVWTVELRGVGSQCVTAGSTHPDTGATYRWAVPLTAGSMPIVEPPSQEGPGARASGREAAPAAPLGSDTEQVLRGLKIHKDYKLLMLEGDTSGYPSRSEALFAILTVLCRDTPLSDEQVTELLLREDCAIGQKARDKKGGATKWLLTQVGVARQRVEAQREVERRFEQAPEEVAEEQGGDAVLEELMRRHAIVSWGGKAAVFRERLAPEEWEGRYDVLTLPQLKVMYQNKPIMVGARRMNPVDIWVNSPNRREYLEGARMVCAPEKCPPGVLNLWQGWGVEPWPEPVSDEELAPWLELTLETLCSGVEEHARWLHDWVGDMLQWPANPKGVHPVLRSGEGTGKGTWVGILGQIVGPHYRHITQESQLTGKFNAHLADAILVNANEMVWAGDRRGHGSLYGMATDPLIMMERKGFDAVPMRNHIHMVVSSNADWVVPAGIDARRWFIPTMSEARKGDHQYFAGIRRWANHTMLRKMLRWYLDRAITSNLRQAPMTEGLVDQKIAGFDSVQAWWHEALERGSVLEPVGDAPPEWEGTVSKARFYNSYRTHCQDARVRPMAYARFFRRLQQVLPEGYPHTVREREGSSRVQALELPPLALAREAMERALRG